MGKILSKLIPSQIKLHQQSRVLEVKFNNKQVFQYPCEYLYSYSKSTEVNENVVIKTIEPQGDYGISFFFDDGYESETLSWQILYDLGLKLSQKNN